MLSSFSIFRTAMLAEPAVTEIEEMVGLIHETRNQGQRSEVRNQMSESQRLVTDL